VECPAVEPGTRLLDSGAGEQAMVPFRWTIKGKPDGLIPKEKHHS
jgi:hypothetical protein